MANITLKRKKADGTFEELYPTTTASQVIGLPTGGGGVTSVAGLTGDVTEAQLISAILSGNVGEGDRIVEKLIAVNGYIKYSSGLIINWGKTQKNNLNVTFNFKKPFTSADSWSMGMIADWAGGGATLNPRDSWLHTKSASGGTFRSGNYDSSLFHISWIAIGY